jgi:hypothetical protein
VRISNLEISKVKKRAGQDELRFCMQEHPRRECAQGSLQFQRDVHNAKIKASPKKGDPCDASCSVRDVCSRSD